MTLTELSTAAQFNIGVKIIILNNEEQGMVTQWQSIFYQDRFSHTHQKNPDFVKLGDAMGVQAQRCIAPNDVEAKLKWLIESDGPALLEIVTDKKVPVLPMVEAGSALHEMRVYDESMSLPLPISFSTGLGKASMLTHAAAKEKDRRAKLKAKMEAVGRAGR